MEFEVRTPKASDVAPMTRIISKVGIREIADSLSPEAMRKAVAGGARENVQELGMSIMLDVASTVCANFDKAEQDLLKFLASMAGMKEKEVADLPLADVLDLTVAVFTSEGFSDFFKRVQALLAR